MADHRRDRRSAPQVDHGPERAEQAGRDGGVGALQQVTRAECDARDDQPDDAAAQPDLEAVQEKRALNLFAHAAGDEHDEREEPRVARRAQEILQRVLFDRVQRRREPPHGEQHDGRDAQRHENQRHAEDRFADDRPPAEQHVARPLAVRVEQHQHEPDEQHGVDQRQADDVADIQAAFDVRLIAERRERSRERELRQEVGAEQDFDEGDDTPPSALVERA